MSEHLYRSSGLRHWKAISMTAMIGRGDNDTSVKSKEWKIVSEFVKNKGIMILPSSQKSSVIKPSQPKMAAVGDPHGGEIPMELNAIAVWCVPCRRALRINSDNRIVWNLELSTNDWFYPDSRRFFAFCCRGI